MKNSEGKNNFDKLKAVMKFEQFQGTSNDQNCGCPFQSRECFSHSKIMSQTAVNKVAGLWFLCLFPKWT